MNDNIANRSMPVTIIRSENYDSIGFDLSFFVNKDVFKRIFSENCYGNKILLWNALFRHLISKKAKNG